MENDELLRRLELHKLSHLESRQRRVPIAAIARMADIGRGVIYDLIRRKRRLRTAEKEKLEKVLEEIDGGTVKIARAGNVWDGDYRDPPETMPPPQDKMVRAADFNEWSVCRTCGGKRYTLVTLHGNPKHWYLCDGCLWWETAGMGARPV